MLGQLRRVVFHRRLWQLCVAPTVLFFVCFMNSEKGVVTLLQLVHVRVSCGVSDLSLFYVLPG
jgi:hypothetical protein